MHDLRRDVVLRRSRTDRGKPRAHAGVVRTRRGPDRGKLPCTLDPAQRLDHPAAVLEWPEPSLQPVEQVGGEEPGVAVDRDAPALEPAGLDDLRHRVGGIRIVRVADDAGEVRVRARVVRLQPAKHQERRTLRRHREALERVVARRLLAAQPEDVLRPARQIEVDAGRGEDALEAPLSRVELLLGECGVAAAHHAFPCSLPRHLPPSSCAVPPLEIIVSRCFESALLRFAGFGATSARPSDVRTRRRERRRS